MAAEGRGDAGGGLPAGPLGFVGGGRAAGRCGGGNRLCGVMFVNAAKIMTHDFDAAKIMTHNFDAANIMTHNFDVPKL